MGIDLETPPKGHGHRVTEEHEAPGLGPEGARRLEARGERRGEACATGGGGGGRGWRHRRGEDEHGSQGKGHGGEDPGSGTSQGGAPDRLLEESVAQRSEDEGQPHAHGEERPARQAGLLGTHHHEDRPVPEVEAVGDGADVTDGSQRQESGPGRLWHQRHGGDERGCRDRGDGEPADVGPCIT